MPSSPPPDRPNRLSEVPGTLLRAVLTGVAIDVCGSRVVEIVTVTCYAMQVVAPGMTDAQAADLLQKTPPSFGLLFVLNMLGMLMSVAGGYACARVALRGEFRVGAILAAVAVVFNLLIDDTGVSDLTLLYILCDVAGLLLGVKYGAERNRRLESPAPSPADASTP
jgi:hypothetical protein